MPTPKKSPAKSPGKNGAPLGEFNGAGDYWASPVGPRSRRASSPARAAVASKPAAKATKTAKPSTKAIEKHDRLNVRVVSVLVAITLYCFAFPSPMAHKALSLAALVYTVGDMIYHVLVPGCQPNTLRVVTIMTHHAATLGLVIHVLLAPEHAAWTMHCMIVEVNTLLLNAMKVYKKPALTALFYLTWFTLRLGYQTYLISTFHAAMVEFGAAPGDLAYLRTVGLHAVVCFLNFFWTVEMGSKMLLKKK